MIREADVIKALGRTVESPGATDTLNILSSDINRPGLPLSGYWHFFSYQRPQVIGKVEKCPEDKDFCLIKFASIEGWVQRGDFFGVYPGETIN